MPDTSPLAGADPSAQSAPQDTTGAEAGPGPADAESNERALYESVAQIIKVVRPAIQADQGDIFLRGVDAETGVVSVELVGACIDCPASSQTLKQGLERILKQRVDGVTEVRHVGEALAGFDDGTKVSL